MAAWSLPARLARRCARGVCENVCAAQHPRLHLHPRDRDLASVRRFMRTTLAAAVGGHSVGHSWLLHASMSVTQGCSKCPRVARVGAPSVHEWHSWVLNASMSGTHGCSEHP